MLSDELAKIKISMDSIAAPPIVNVVRELFPHEEFWLAADEVDEEERRFQTQSANISGVEQALRIRGVETESDSQTTPNGSANLKHRLTVMLAAFSVGNRKARYPADLVACWASMCNINYAYSRNDSTVEALAKVIIALRNRGLTIFNFFINYDPMPLTVDRDFFLNAAEVRQMNILNAAPFSGAPAFIGRTDTVTHILRSCTNIFEVALKSIENPVPVRLVKGAEVVEFVKLATPSKIRDAFERISYGREDRENIVLAPVKDWLGATYRLILESLPMEISRRSFCIVRIPVILDPRVCSLPTKAYLWAWLICPSPVSLTPRTAFSVAREAVNGTLVLVQEISIDDFTSYRWPVGYVTMTDNCCGTWLVQTSEEGKIEIALKMQSVRGIYVSTYAMDRILSCTVQLDDEELYL